MVVDRQLPTGLIERLLEQEIPWVPTLELWNCTDLRAMALSNLRRFSEAGGRVALGTDFAGYTCRFDLGMPMTEIELMELAGMTPMEIIVAATRNAARVCNLQRDLGTLEQGKIADVLVVAGDPLSDLHALEDPKLVIHDGVVIRNELPPPAAPNPRRPLGRVD